MTSKTTSEAFIPYSAKRGRKISTSNNKVIKALQAFFKKIIDASEDAPVIIRKIEKRLRSTNRNRQPVKLSLIEEKLPKDKVAVVVAKVLDDERLLKIKAMKIVALKWSHSAEEKIKKNGGSIHTLDEFIKVGKDIENLVFISQDPNQRKSAKYWGLAPGEKNSTSYPRANHKIKNKERRMNVKKAPKYEIEDKE